MTIIYDIEADAWMKKKDNEHAVIFQDYMAGKFKATHKRVKNEEFWHFPKLFLYPDHVGIVTGDQEKRGGLQYVRHCKTFEYSVDRVHRIVFLKERTKRKTQEETYERNFS